MLHLFANVYYMYIYNQTKFTTS